MSNSIMDKRKNRFNTLAPKMNYKPANDGAKPDVNHFNLEAMRN